MLGWGLRGRDRHETARSQRGATLIEFSMIFPIMVLILISILELGMLFKNYLTVSALSREGARVGALAGRDIEADCAIAIGIGTLAQPGILTRLDTIEIYRANVNGTVIAGPNTAAFQGGDPARCTAANTGDIDDWVVNSNPWPPGSRETHVGPNVKPDIIGIRVRMQHDWIIGFPPFSGPGVLIDERTITRLEPQAFEPTPIP
jgi:Flp pilus assembly protein TadG